MQKLLITFLLWYAGLPAHCQSVSYGFKTGYITYHRLYSDAWIAGTHIRGSQGPNGYMDGWRLAGLARVDHNGWMAQAELAYAFNIGGNGPVVVIDNWHNPSNTTHNDQWIVGELPLLRNVEFSLNGGYKPAKWLTLSGGFGLWHQKPRNPQGLVVLDENGSNGFNDYTRTQNDINRFRYGVEKSFLPFVLTGQLGIGTEIKGFLLGITYDRSLTPVSRKLRYKDQDYLFWGRTDRFVLSAGYRFKPTKVSAVRND